MANSLKRAWLRPVVRLLARRCSLMPTGASSGACRQVTGLCAERLVADEYYSATKGFSRIQIRQRPSLACPPAEAALQVNKFRIRSCSRHVQDFTRSFQKAMGCLTQTCMGAW